MTAREMKFGFYPDELDFTAGSVMVRTLPDQAKDAAAISECKWVEGDWLYAPPQKAIQLVGMVRTCPYPSRVFSLPKTHIIEHANADSDDHLGFLIWALSFFVGMRLTATDAGFLDATPIKPGALVDFICLGKNLETAVDLAEAFWQKNRECPKRHKLFSAATHALFVGHNPRLLEFERFMYLYTALDACYALAASLNHTSNRPSHNERIAWVCHLLNMSAPSWAKKDNAPSWVQKRKAIVAVIRNDAFHEALFMDEPLGFWGPEGGGEFEEEEKGLIAKRITREMEALICRFLAAFLKVGVDEYVHSPVDSRQIYELI